MTTYTYNVSAYDAAGNDSAQSQPAVVTTLGNQVPTVSLVSPTNNASFAQPTTINLQAQASDADGSVVKVEFFQGSTKLGEDATVDANGLYNFTWSNVAAGNYSLTARATDNAGATANSSPVNITVSNADFSLSASPISRNVRRGGRTTYTITVTPSGGFTGVVGLSVNGVPSNTTAGFNPLSVTTSGSSTLTVSTSSATPTGNHTLTVYGSSGALRRSVTLTLNVKK
ncbi:MAG: Ig-like domain-containing protein [Pyrinomonadaceae bacterium]